MGTELQTTNQNQSVSLADMRVMAEAMAKSHLFPSCQTTENALALMLLCQSEGIHPAQAVRRFHVIKGTCSMRADAMLAEFQRQGGKIQWVKYDATEAAAKFSHASGGDIEFSYTIAEAQKAGLVNPGSGWTKFPGAMLRARCISGGIRMVLPGVVCGIYTPEEVEDFDGPGKPPKTGKPELKPVKHENLNEKIGFSQAETVAPIASMPEEKSAESAVENLVGAPDISTVPNDQLTPAGIVAKELKAIRILAQKAGCKSTEEMKATTVNIIGHDIESSQSLTAEERLKVIATLENMISEAA